MKTKGILKPHHALITLLHFTIICVLGVIYFIVFVRWCTTLYLFQTLHSVKSLA